MGCLIEVAQTLVLTIVIFWLIQTLVAQPFQVQQQSMLTTLRPDDYVLVDKLTPRFSAYARGDIVVFDPVRRDGSCAAEPERVAAFDGTPYIKRVIGEPGDTVELRDGTVIVNGKTLDEPYTGNVASIPLGDETSWTVPPDRLFLLGDNRGDSVDSRSESLGLVCGRDVIGRAFLRYWPVDALAVIARPAYQQ